MKVIRIEMPDGSIWQVPASIVAENYANYFSNQDAKVHKLSLKEKQELYEGDYNYMMSDECDILDWASNNMDWSDVKNFAILIEDSSEGVDFQEGWVNGRKEVIEVEEVGEDATSGIGITYRLTEEKE